MQTCIRIKFNFFEVVRQQILNEVSNVKYNTLSSSEKILKSVKISQNYHHKRVARFLRHDVCSGGSQSFQPNNFTVERFT